MTKDNRWIRLASAIAIAGAFYASMAKAAEPGPTALADSKPPSPRDSAAASGTFSFQKRGADRFHIALAGHVFTSRGAIEQYLAYRAAELAKEEHRTWLTLIENRSKGDTVPTPHLDPAGPHFSFRMEYWRPMWRTKIATSPEWKGWSPFSGAAFIVGDPKNISSYEVSADIVLHKGAMASGDPLAFDAGALSDFLANQVSPPL